jgi:hypothetical protein
VPLPVELGFIYGEFPTVAALGAPVVAVMIERGETDGF